MDFELDNLLTEFEDIIEESSKPTHKFKVGDIVEALWYQDSLYYQAKILTQEANWRYNLVFIEYGNEQVTNERDIISALNVKGDQLKIEPKQQPTKVEQPKIEKKFEAVKTQPKTPPTTPPTTHHQPKTENKPIGRLNSKFLSEEVKDSPSKTPSSKSPPKFGNSSLSNSKMSFNQSNNKSTKPIENKKPQMNNNNQDEILDDPELKDLMEKTQNFLNGAKEKLENSLKTSPSSLGYSSLANLLTEMAVIPLNSINSSNNIFDESFRFFQIAENLEKNNPVILLKYAHCLLRNAIYMREKKYTSQASEYLDRAYQKYSDTFKHTPNLETIKYLIFSKSANPTLNSTHFLGLYDNGYSDLYNRLKNQDTLNKMLEIHWQKVLNWNDTNKSSTDLTSIHPIFRYHCFEALKSLVNFFFFFL